MKIIVAGDFCPRGRLVSPIVQGQYADVFPDELRYIIKDVDFSFINLEAPIECNTTTPIVKCGPNLKCPKETIGAIKYLGFNVVTMANNHILDYGTEGLNRTIQSCKEEGLEVVGVGSCLAKAEEVLFVEKDSKVLAIINCCEHEFSIATSSSAGANPLNPVFQYNKIIDAKQKADNVIVIVHGGHEHHQYPSPRMRDTYRFFIDAGADAVVNHHQHCYSGFEEYKGKPIFYGLGNFCFDKIPVQIDTNWNYGLLAIIDFDINGVSFDYVPYKQCDYKPIVQLLPKAVVSNRLEEINRVISDRDALYQFESEYLESKFKDSLEIIQPIKSRLFTSLRIRNLFPKYRNKQWLLLLYNFFICESHREELKAMLESYINSYGKR